MSTTPINRLPVNSRVVAFDTKLQARQNVQDIYTMKSGDYNRKNGSWSEGSIIMGVKDQTASKGVITLKEKLRLPGVYGQTQALGTEEDVRTKDLAVFQANYRKVINEPGYGLRELEASKYKLYEEQENDVTEWNQEEEGYQLRHAFVERYAPNLSDASSDTAADCVENWNTNIFIPTALPQEQPTYDADRATYTTNIVNSLVATGGMGQLTQRTMTATVFEDLSNWLLNPKRIARLKIPQLPTGSGYVVTVSELMAAMLSNPLFTSNNLGSLWLARNQIPETIQKWPGVIGCYNDMVIIVDSRQPTLLPSGSSSPYSLTAGYMVWGSRDLRNRDQANIKDTAFVHGAGSLVKVEGEKLHWIADEYDYAFHKGLGTAGVRGYQLPIYTDRSTGEVVQPTSALVILDLPNQGILST